MTKVIAAITLFGALGCLANDCSVETPTLFQQGEAAAMVVRASANFEYPAGIVQFTINEYYKGRGPLNSNNANFYVGGFNSTGSTEECGVNVPASGSEGVLFLCAESFGSSPTYFGLNDQGPQSGYVEATTDNIAFFASTEWDDYLQKIGNPPSRISYFDIYGCGAV